MATDPSLERVQRWMQACILQPGTCEEAILSEVAQAEIPAEAARGIVLPSKTLSAQERLNIYREMYLPRMEEALAIDYPALKHFLGREEFMRVVARYVDAYPSRSYTLNRLGDHLPEFLAALGRFPRTKHSASIWRGWNTRSRWCSMRKKPRSLKPRRGAGRAIGRLGDSAAQADRAVSAACIRLSSEPVYRRRRRRESAFREVPRRKAGLSHIAATTRFIAWISPSRRMSCFPPSRPEERWATRSPVS